jgi:hypothetical protein
LLSVDLTNGRGFTRGNKRKTSSKGDKRIFGALNIFNEGVPRAARQTFSGPLREGSSALGATMDEL